MTACFYVNHTSQIQKATNGYDWLVPSYLENSPGCDVTCTHQEDMSPWNAFPVVPTKAESSQFENSSKTFALLWPKFCS